MKLLGLPGWSCTRTLDEWMGCPIQVVGHFEQLQALDSGVEAIKGLLPKGEWTLVTWSMGTKLGLQMAELWGDNPPKMWIALSPFLHFSEKASASDYEDVMQLKAGLIAKPESALKLFTRSHGVRAPWMDQSLNDEKVALLADSLDILCEPFSYPSSKLDLPIYAFFGSKDSLVNEWMVDEFCDKVGAKKVSSLEGVSHALFYEQPELLRSALKEHLKFE